MPYLLQDFINSDWHLFSKPIQNMTNIKNRMFSENEEAARKDVERLLAVMKKDFKYYD